MLTQEFLSQLKGFRATINNIHIRYEDDFFVSSPYAIGLTMEKLTLSTANDEIHSFTSMKTDHKPSQNEEAKSDMFQFVNNLSIEGMRVYLNSKTEVIIPTEKWVLVKDLDEV